MIQISLPILFLGLAVTLTGCSKKQASEGSSAEAPGQPSGTASTSPADSQASAGKADTSRMISEANAAMKTKDYDKAVEAALAAQQQRALTDAQSAAIHNQMIQLQQELVKAIANGDAKAKAAADRLRGSASGAH